jgi:hypothetical protein
MTAAEPDPRPASPARGRCGAYITLLARPGGGRVPPLRALPAAPERDHAACDDAHAAWEFNPYGLLVWDA